MNLNDVDFVVVLVETGLRAEMRVANRAWNRFLAVLLKYSFDNPIVLKKIV